MIFFHRIKCFIKIVSTNLLLDLIFSTTIIAVSTANFPKRRFSSFIIHYTMAGLLLGPSIRTN